jgi:hypothetical protein
MMQALEAVTAVKAVLAAEEQMDTWLYVTVVDPTNEPCFNCLEHEQHLYTSAEVADLFPWLIKMAPDMWLPQVHPNCRCQLFGYSVIQDVQEKQRLGLLPIKEEDKVASEYQKIHEYIEKNKLPKPPEESPPNKDAVIEKHINRFTEYKVTFNEDGLLVYTQKMPDQQFDDIITGLLSAGYITSVIAEAIRKRRKTAKEKQSK